MFDIGFSELTLIFVVGLVVLGPKRLPEVLRAVTSFVSTVRSQVSRLTEEISSQTHLDEVERLREQFRQAAQTVQGNVRQVQDSLSGVEDTARQAWGTPAEDPVQPAAPAPVDMPGLFVAPAAKRYKPQAGLEEVLEEIGTLRGELDLPRKTLTGNNRKWVPHSRVNRPRIYR